MGSGMAWTTTLLCVVSEGTHAAAAVKNGFELGDATIPVHEIRFGGPPRDGIPAIDTPWFVRADDARFLADDDRVLGFARGNASKAYPIRILDRHEIVNDKNGDHGLLVTYCPLCGTGMIWVDRAT